MIKMTNISKSYGELNVLSKLDLEILKNEKIALLGKSGYGKTTLLRIILGLENIDSGTLVIEEGVKFSVVFQEDRLIDNCDIQTNILLPHLGKKHNILPECVQEILQQLDVTAPLDKKVSQLSGGMRCRVSIARALLVESDMIVMDEPFKGLDGATKMRVMEVVQKNIVNKTMFLITHDKSESEFFDCRMIELNKSVSTVLM